MLGRLLLLRGGYNLELDSGSASITGQDASFLRSLVMPLAGGTYTITGSEVSLISSEGYSLALDPGAYTLTGTAASLKFARKLSLSAGACTLTGSDLAFSRDYSLPLGSGTVGITGQDATPKFDRALSLGSGEFALTGTDLSFSVDTCAIDGVVVFLFTLTGDADSTTDVEIPISSFQARMRSGESTYLSVVIPGMDYASYITARSNGDLKIDVAYMVGGEITNRENIIVVNLEDIRTDKGPINQSITLTGHKQVTYTSKSITLYRPIYRYALNGALRYRFAEPSLHLYPGDTVNVDSDTFVADSVYYYVQAIRGGAQMTMEIAE